MSTIEIPIRVDLQVAESVQQYALTIEESTEAVSIEVATPIVTSTAEDYTGQTTVTPTQETQVFQTEGKRVLHDFIVNPIPHNYGLITYNGQYITVS